MSRGDVRQTRGVWAYLSGVTGAVVGAVLGLLPGAYLGWKALLMNDRGPSSLHNGWDLSVTGCISNLPMAFLVGAVGALAGGWVGRVAGERLAGGRRQQAGTGGGEVIDLAPAPPPG